MVKVRNLHLGAVRDALAEDRGMNRCGGRGTVLLGTGLVGLVVAALAGVAGGAGGAGTTATAGVVAGTARLLGLDDVIKGHIEGVGHG